jgi:hypothetical protein
VQLLFLVFKGNRGNKKLSNPIFFSKYTYVEFVDKNGLGYILGDFFHKLLRSPGLKDSHFQKSMIWFQLDSTDGILSIKLVLTTTYIYYVIAICSTMSLFFVVFLVSNPLHLSSYSALLFCQLFFFVHHPLNLDDQHLLAHSMATDFTVAWQFFSKITFVFLWTEFHALNLLGVSPHSFDTCAGNGVICGSQQSQ